MAAQETDNLKLPYILPSQAQKHVTHNEAIRALDALVQMAVLDRDLAAPPALPAAGQRFIVAAGATGSWTGAANRIAAFQDDAWAFFQPQAGWLCWVQDEARLVFWNGAAWTLVSPPVTALQNLSLLGLGTAADATNPFAAKLNKALWTARTASEGGDGDLRLTLNKETAADTLSLVFQDGYSGRAELGLIGDDDLVLKVSGNGTAWGEAFRVTGATGDVTLPRNLTIWPGAADVSSGIYIDSQGAASSNLYLTNYRDAASEPAILQRHARGTRTAPSALASGDRIGGFRWYGHDGAGFFQGAFVAGATAEAWSATARGTYLFFSTVAPGTTTLTERFRVSGSGDLQMGGANTVVDANRIVRLRAYTVATLPAPSTAGQTVFCSDLGGGGGALVSDGAAWRRAGGGGQQSVSTDAAFTLTALANAENQRHAGTLTADRTITLSAANAYSGARFRVTRTGGGAFSLSLGGLRNLAVNTWAEAVHDGSNWYLSAYGAL